MSSQKTLGFPEILKIWVFKVSFALNFHSTSELPSRTFALFFGIVQEPFGMHCSVIKVPFPPPFFRASFAILSDTISPVNRFLGKISGFFSSIFHARFTLVYPFPGTYQIWCFGAGPPRNPGPVTPGSEGKDRGHRACASRHCPRYRTARPRRIRYLSSM